MKLFHPFNMRIFLQFVICTIFEILVLFVSPCWPRSVPTGSHTASKYWIKQIPLSSTGSSSNTTVANATHSGRSTALHFYSTLSLVIPTSTLESTREKCSIKEWYPTLILINKQVWSPSPCAPTQLLQMLQIPIHWISTSPCIIALVHIYLLDHYITMNTVLQCIGLWFAVLPCKQSGHSSRACSE